MTVASPKLRLFRRSMPHIPLRYMWGFQQFTLLRSVSAYCEPGAVALCRLAYLADSRSFAAGLMGGLFCGVGKSAYICYEISIRHEQNRFDKTS